MIKNEMSQPVLPDRVALAEKPWGHTGGCRVPRILGMLRALLILSIFHSAVPARAGEGSSPGRAGKAPTAPTLEVTFLIHDGFLLRSDGRTVLIDAFVEVGEASRGSLPPEVYEEMLAGNPPFSSVLLSLASHAHNDHFEPTVAGSFLRKHPETVLASSPDVLEALRADYPEYEAVKDQLKEVRTEKNEIVSLTLSGIRVDFLQFGHQASLFYPEKVLGHIVHLGGKKILHFGDSELLIERLEPYHLESRGIDVAFLPSWFFESENARAILEKHIGAEKLIAMRLPPSEMEEAISAVSGRFPDVLFLKTPMQSLEF
ncbi:MAG: MBL fold metallo-hydrolase [Candidatus Krumholzibacteriia bacterium]